MSITQMIKRAVISLAGKDDSNHAIGQVKYNNKTGDIELVFPYGMSANPPKGALALMFNIMGQEENRAGIPYYPQIRFRNLKEGETAFGNPMTESVIKFLEDGKIDITSNDNLEIQVNGDLNLTVTGNMTVNALGGAVDLNGDFNLGGSGGAAIARVGDTVAGGIITSGSANHKAT